MPKNVVILGGGLTGLVLTEQLQGDDINVTLLEKEKCLGGMCTTRSKIIDGNNVLYDLGPHKFASFEKRALDYFIKIVKHPIIVYKSSHIYLKGRHLRYPVSMIEILKSMPLVGIRCGIGFVGSFLRFDGNTYEKYMQKRFGGYVYDLVFKGYAEKVWGDPKTLDAQLARTRMAATSLVDMLMDMLSGSSRQSFEKFFYCSNGIGEFIKSISDKAIKSGALIRFGVKNISIKNNMIKFISEGTTYEITADKIISTIPPADLADAIGVSLDSELESINYRKLILHYYLFDKNKVDFKDTWVFFPEENIVFNRLSKNWSPDMVPEGKVCICAEITNPELNKEFVDSKVFDYFKLNKNDVISSWTDGIENAYPIYHLGFKEEVDELLDVFEMHNIYCVGRQACHNYNNMDHCVLEAVDLAQMIKDGKSIEDWRYQTKIYDWRIVD